MLMTRWAASSKRSNVVAALSGTAPMQPEMAAECAPRLSCSRKCASAFVNALIAATDSEAAACSPLNVTFASSSDRKPLFDFGSSRVATFARNASS